MNVKHATNLRSDIIKSIDDGARALLKDTANTLSSFPDLEYMVIGGWCPVLRNTSRIKHPGTLDVDILFRESYKSGCLKDVMKSFIDRGFMPSAKHSFQLLRPQMIDGMRYIYNIDFLHPRMTENPDEIRGFVKHLELDVPLNNSEKELKKMMSIVLPNSEILFRESLFDEFSQSGEVFKLVSFLGMFITKMDSCQRSKRERDSFDIYLAFLSDGIDVNKIETMAEGDGRIKDSLEIFKTHLKEHSEIFDKNVQHFCKSIKDSPAKFILNKLND
ncbi:TPA: hypothetical protein JAN90_02345 [Legionella pneumophila]|nr:hypothetical protein [Legionella pneumophila]HAT8866819.1 hypothetical protein [Legionella pneumophila subsp. pneumophila]HAT7071634.1 hypothetical protein [Legionella pneumophila]HAT8641813.1 hypothetical protein [Legionella pneumophila]HAT8889809.1 hypothetical protein [Legionella pneumophila subsp. pneumophila]HAT8931922.1 hypothetical protein [Legionella pneumophila subsp. pneumophila]